VNMDDQPQTLSPQQISQTTQHPSVARTNLLISIRSPEEVAAAISGGADWIDLKEPKLGPLGAVPVDIAQKIVDAVDGRLPISAALGELLEWDNAPARDLLRLPEIQVVKLGLAGCAQLSNWQSLWKSAATAIAKTDQDLVAVAYADWQHAGAPAPAEIIATANAAGSRYFLIDTFDKKSGGLLTHLSLSELTHILRLAHEASLSPVVAGSLVQADLAAISTLEVDMIGVRGGVCGGNRNSNLDPQLVANFRAALSTHAR